VFGSLVGDSARSRLLASPPVREAGCLDHPEGDALRPEHRGATPARVISLALYRSSTAGAGRPATLLWTVVNKLGLTADNTIEPDALLLNGAPTGRPLEDLSEAELEQVLAQNVREPLLRRFLLETVLAAPQNDWPSLSPAPVSVALAGLNFPAELAERPLNELTGAEAALLTTRT